MLLRFGWVLAALASTAWLGLWQAQIVGMRRRAAGVAYPQGGHSFLGLSFFEIHTWTMGSLQPMQRKPRPTSQKLLSVSTVPSVSLSFSCVTSRNLPVFRCPFEFPRESPSCYHHVSLRSVPARFLRSRFPNRRGLIWGLKQPVYSAIVLEMWVLTRFWYTYGYINYGPKGVRTLRPPRLLFPR